MVDRYLFDGGTRHLQTIFPPLDSAAASTAPGGVSGSRMAILLLAILCVAAAVSGYRAPRWWTARPVLAVGLAAILPLLAWWLIYRGTVRAGDWEGMGAIAFTLLGAVWGVVALASGLISIRRGAD